MMQANGSESCVVNLGPVAPLVDQFRASGVPVVSLGMLPSWRGFSRGLSLLRAEIRKYQPSIVQGWMYHGNLMVTTASLYGSNSHPKVFWNIRRSLDDLSKLSKRTQSVIRANRLLSWHPAGIIYCSTESGAQHQRYGFSAKRTHVIENGFDTKRFSLSSDVRSMTRNRLGIDDDQITVGCVARYDPAKGHTYLLRALSLVCAHRSNVRVVLVGRNVDEKNRELIESINELGLGPVVKLLGEQDSIESIYSALDIYCSPSINEGFPNVVSEAMSIGLLCVVTDTGASMRLVGDSGFSVPTGDVEALAQALLKAVDMEPAQRHSMGQRARSIIVNNFGMDEAVQQYTSLYQSLL
jgi:glycosyltransferase involved in cell wall biosynthesis